jgi:alcohol dehydrogenase class IV
MEQLSVQVRNVFYSPNKLVFGLGVSSSLADELSELGIKRPLIVTDRGVVDAGILEKIIHPLKAKRIKISVFDGVEPEPPARIVDEAASMLRAQRCDCVVGLGGGSSLDVAKGVAVLATNRGSILDYCGMDLVKRAGIPKILIPTTSGTGSEVTRVVVVTDEAQNTKRALYSRFALAEVAMVDPLLTLTAPRHVTADTGMDALVHAIETYVSANATPFSDLLAERAIQLIAKYLPMAWAKGGNVEARYYMSLGATTAGLAFASGGLGAVHALAYPLGTEYHMAHGRSNAIMLPHVMRHNTRGNPEKFARIAQLMGRDTTGLSPMEAAMEAVSAVEDLMDSIELSFRFKDHGIPEADLPKLVEGAMKQNRFFGPNPTDMDEDSIRRIYEDAYRA